MEATAKCRFTRLSPRRAGLVADAVRGKSIEEAMTSLEFMTNKPSTVIKKVLKSAIANAGNKEGMDTESLFVSKIIIGEGPVWKRIMPRAMGRASSIHKNTSHVYITVSDGYKPKSKEKRKKTLAKKAVAEKTVKKSKAKNKQAKSEQEKQEK